MADSFEKHFKLVRRESLKVECPEGVFDEFEEIEDAPLESDPVVSHSECMMLQRVLSDKSKIPLACAMPLGLTNTGASSALQVQQTKVPELVRRMSGGVPGAFEPDPTPAKKKELGGPVSLRECQDLNAFLKPSVGGAYLLPGACGTLLKRAEADARAAVARANQDGGEAPFQRLKRRFTEEIAKEEFPPTFV